MKTLLFLGLLLITISYGKNKDNQNKNVKKADTSYTFDNVTIQGYLDNPTPIYIMDADGGENLIIDLDRDFNKSLQRNTDKEFIIRNIND